MTVGAKLGEGSSSSADAEAQFVLSCRAGPLLPLVVVVVVGDGFFRDALLVGTDSTTLFKVEELELFPLSFFVFDADDFVEEEDEDR